MIELGDKIDGRYRVVSRIAHGGMADVYEGYDIVYKRPVALKIMRKDMMGSEKNIERFHRECVAAASLNDPNIVKVYGEGTVDGRPYMVNEYVDGRTLRDKLNVVAGHFLSPLEASEIMVQLCSGVSYIHQHGLLHRDIKPDNLFYLPDGSIKIADFGISTPIGDSSSNGDAIAGRQGTRRIWRIKNDAPAALRRPAQPLRLGGLRFAHALLQALFAAMTTAIQFLFAFHFLVSHSVLHGACAP